MNDGARALHLAEVGVGDDVLSSVTGRGHRYHLDAGHDGLGHELAAGGSQDVAGESHVIDAATIRAISDDLIERLFAIIDSSIILKRMADVGFRKLDRHFQNTGVEDQEGLVGIILQEVYLNVSASLDGHMSSRYSDGYTHLAEPHRSKVDTTVSASVKTLKLPLNLPIVSDRMRQPVMEFSKLLEINHIPGTDPAVAEILGNVWVAVKGKFETEEARKSAPRGRAS